MNIDVLMNQFRLASRELFNNYFRLSNPYEDDKAWPSQARFADVEILLFDKMVTEPAGLQCPEYGQVQPRVQVKLNSEFAPIMISRAIKSGYWDYPVKEITTESEMIFISFFDWDQLGVHDNRYVKVEISGSTKHPEIVGKQALIESQYVSYFLNKSELE
jgi:hypothetical protein